MPPCERRRHSLSSSVSNRSCGSQFAQATSVHYAFSRLQWLPNFVRAAKVLSESHRYTLLAAYTAHAENNRHGATRGSVRWNPCVDLYDARDKPRCPASIQDVSRDTANAYAHRKPWFGQGIGDKLPVHSCRVGLTLASPKKKDHRSLSAGLPAEFTLKSWFRIAPGALPEESSVKSSGATSETAPNSSWE